MDTKKELQEVSDTLRVLIKAADDEITAFHAVFGAPEDYETKEREALFALYNFQIELRAAIRQTEG